VTGPRPAARARRTVRALLRLAPLTITGFMQFSWFGSLAVSPDPYAIVRRDWHQFFQTGHQLVAGDLSAIYPRTFESGYFWLYPPYCIYLTAPLGMLPEWWAYALCVVVEVLAVAVALHPPHGRLQRLERREALVHQRAGRNIPTDDDEIRLDLGKHGLEGRQVAVDVVQGRDAHGPT